MASHLLCASCRGGVESNAALMIEAEVALSDEWKRLSVATQKVYQALGGGLISDLTGKAI